MPLVDNFQSAGARHPGSMMDHFDPLEMRTRPALNRRTRMPVPDNFVSFRRPFLDDDDQPCVLANTGDWTVEKGERKPIKRKHRVVDLLNDGYPVPMWLGTNATTMRKEDWIELDREIVLAAREPLVAWADLEAANSYGGFDAYGKMTLEYEAMADYGFAQVDMDGMTVGNTQDNPLFTLRSMPLPITHSDFYYSDRQIQVSANGGSRLDTVTGEQAARRVSEVIEDTTIGTVTGVTYGTVASGNYASHEGTSTIYGYQNFTYRSTKTNLTVPTGANPQTVLADVLGMIQTLINAKFYGPYTLYLSLAWNQYLDNDYAFTNGSNWAVNTSLTLRQRLQAIGGDDPNLNGKIQAVKLLPRWTAPTLSGGSAGTYAMILIDMKKETAQAVNGQPITTIQWDSMGGFRKNFKVWCIQAPRLRARYNQGTGLLHATTS